MPYNPDKVIIQMSPEVRQKLKVLKGKFDATSYEEVIDELIRRQDVWIGNFRDNKNHWYIAWGDGKSETDRFIVSQSQRDIRTMGRLNGPGVFTFFADIIKYTDKKGNEHESIDMKKLDDNIIFFLDEDIEEWMMYEVIQPLDEEPIKSDYIQMKKKDYEELMRLVPSCPKCNDKPYDKYMGCQQCNYHETFDGKKKKR